jgi:hypothetical protein
MGELITKANYYLTSWQEIIEANGWSSFTDKLLGEIVDELMELPQAEAMFIVAYMASEMETGDTPTNINCEHSFLSCALASCALTDRAKQGALS